jgi:hypothetical protein
MEDSDMNRRSKFGISRRGALGVLSGLIVATGVAWAAEHVVIDFAAPPTVTTGQPIATTVQVNQAPMSITFTSNPPGLVSFATTVSSTTQGVSVPTSSAAPAGSYTITVAPSAGGTGKSVGVLASKPVGN